MEQALFICGVYEDTLKEILKAQKNNPERRFYLQPHDTKVWRMFRDEPKPVRLLISVTKPVEMLNFITYECTLHSWRNKIELSEKEKSDYGREIDRFQHAEGGLYMINEKGETYKNLLVISDLQPLHTKKPTSLLIKRSDKKPYKKKTQSGKGSAIWISADWYDQDTLTRTEFERTDSLQRERARRLSDDELRKKSKNKAPDVGYSMVRIKQFSRDPYMRELRLRMANGVCELCKEDAPFMDREGRPFLEVHHKQPLAEGGPDTLDNTEALCPNCHRERHFGPNK